MNRVGLAARAALGWAGAFLTFLALWAGCSAAPRPPNPQLTTLYDVQALYAGGAAGDTAIATDAGLPGGIRIDHLIKSDGVSLTLALGPAWAEGYPVAYVTTEVWAFYDRVWVQPMYVPVTGFVAGAPQRVEDPSGLWHPIFGVGAGSGFYSPFWQTVYVEVPPGTAYDAITSVRQVVDGGYPLQTAAGWVAPLAPADVTLTADAKVGGFGTGTGWVAGAQTPFIDFPVIPFTWDEAQVVEEVPLYYFLLRKDDGSLVTLPIPTVLGTGPPYSNTPPPKALSDGRHSPKYSAYWRLYTVVVPAGATVYAPPGDPAGDPLADHLVGVGAPVLTADAYGTSLTEGDVGRVALDPACFATDPETCVFLDSQAAIEGHIDPGSIERTGITVTCPIVSVDGLAVTP